ncbi:MAG TPA: SoxR reducing system RseC family protein [Paludibacter sp.]
MSQIIEHTGIINHIEGSHIRVSIIQQSACSDCHAKGACTAADMDEKYIDLESSDASFKIGDRVMLYGQSSTGLIAVLLAFVLPFLLILITLFILRYYVANEILSGAIALSVLIPYYIILSLFNKKMKARFRFYIKKEVAE